MAISFHPYELNTKQFYVYKITYQNGKPFYIGKGQNCRYKHHFIKKSPLNKFIRNKLKIQPLRVVILKDNLTEEKAFRLEVKLIKRYGRKDIDTGVLLNKTDGGEGPSGIVWPEESRIKISKSLEGNKYALGYKHSKEHNRKISLGNKGNKQSEETIRKRVESRKGYIHTEETKINISESLKGNISPMKERSHTEESKRKISKSMKGKPWSKARREAQKTK